MTNEDKLKQTARNIAYNLGNKVCDNIKTYGYEDVYNAALQAMALKEKERKELWRITRNHYQEWAEEQIAKEKQKLIDKACEFIENHGFIYHIDFPNLAAVAFHYSHKDALIEDFKKEMKGE